MRLRLVFSASKARACHPSTRHATSSLHSSTRTSHLFAPATLSASRARHKTVQRRRSCAPRAMSSRPAVAYIGRLCRRHRPLLARRSEVASEAITSAEGACRGPEWSGGAGRGWLGSRRPRAPRPRRGEEAASARTRAGHHCGHCSHPFRTKKGGRSQHQQPASGDSLRAPWGAFGDARGDTAGSRQHFDTWTPDWGRLASL